jgi:hypothetical protein
VGISSYVYNTAGLCGPLVSVGSLGTNYNYGVVGTNLGNDCPTDAPTPAPPTTASPTSALPCCNTLRLNPIFCCIEARNPELALSVCQECLN